jgi:hypothetical protein
VIPQSGSSYASFEINILEKDYSGMIREMASVFRPGKFSIDLTTSMDDHFFSLHLTVANVLSGYCSVKVMPAGQAAGLVSPAGAEVCGTRHLNVDRTLKDISFFSFSDAEHRFGSYINAIPAHMQEKCVTPAGHSHLAFQSEQRIPAFTEMANAQRRR